jgi:hypothetical protein
MKYNTFTISFHSYCMDENTCNAIHEFSMDEWSSFHGWNKDNQWFLVQKFIHDKGHMGFWMQFNHVAKFVANKAVPPIAGSFVMNN